LLSTEQTKSRKGKCSEVFRAVKSSTWPDILFHSTSSRFFFAAQAKADAMGNYERSRAVDDGQTRTHPKPNAVTLDFLLPIHVFFFERLSGHLRLEE
jgi:spermidine synthase